MHMCEYSISQLVVIKGPLTNGAPQYSVDAYVLALGSRFNSVFLLRDASTGYVRFLTHVEIMFALLVK